MTTGVRQQVTLCCMVSPASAVCTLEWPHVGVHENGVTGERWYGSMCFPSRVGPWSPL